MGLFVDEIGPSFPLNLSTAKRKILQPLLKPAVPSYTIYSISLPPSHFLRASSPEFREVLPDTRISSSRVSNENGTKFLQISY